jgi:hypothetical protein
MNFFTTEELAVHPDPGVTLDQFWIGTITAVRRST